MPVRDITRRDIVALISQTESRAPIMARRLLSHIRTMLDWAVEQGLLDSSPAASVKAPERGADRERSFAASGKPLQRLAGRGRRSSGC